MNPTHRVLIVEDDPAVVELLHDLLRFEGYDVVGVLDPVMAPRVAEHVQPSIVIVDLMLHGTSGFEVAQQLHELGFVQTPILAMSASQVMLQFAEQSNLFDGTIHKPFDLEHVLQHIKQHIARHESH